MRRHELKICKIEIWGPSLLSVPITSCTQELHVFCNGPATFPRGKNSGILRDFPATLLCPDPSLEPPSAEHQQPHRASTDHYFQHPGRASPGRGAALVIVDSLLLMQSQWRSDPSHCIHLCSYSLHCKAVGSRPAPG